MVYVDFVACVCVGMYELLSPPLYHQRVCVYLLDEVFVCVLLRVVGGSIETVCVCMYMIGVYV